MGLRAQVDLDTNNLPEGVVCLPPGSGATQTEPLTSLAVSEDGALLAGSSRDGVVGFHLCRPATAPLHASDKRYTSICRATPRYVHSPSPGSVQRFRQQRLILPVMFYFRGLRRICRT